MFTLRLPKKTLQFLVSTSYFLSHPGHTGLQPNAYCEPLGLDSKEGMKEGRILRITEVGSVLPMEAASQSLYLPVVCTLSVYGNKDRLRNGLWCVLSRKTAQSLSSEVSGWESTVQWRRRNRACVCVQRAGGKIGRAHV